MSVLGTRGKTRTCDYKGQKRGDPGGRGKGHSLRWVAGGAVPPEPKAKPLEFTLESSVQDREVKRTPSQTAKLAVRSPVYCAAGTASGYLETETSSAALTGGNTQKQSRPAHLAN